MKIKHNMIIMEKIAAMLLLMIMMIMMLLKKSVNLRILMIIMKLSFMHHC